MCSVMIVEDEASLAHNIKEYLEEDGFDAQVCNDEETALKALSAFHPSIVVLDYRLPGMDGLAVLKLLRVRAPMAKVIMLTAHGTRQTETDAILAGAYDYQAKSVRLNELRRTIDQAWQSL